MTDFRINVILDPSGATRGAREVERELTRVETSANKVQNSLRRAFTGVTLGLVVREIVRYADSLTDLQNRLRLLVPEQAALVRTTKDLLKVANDTRTALDGTVILYQRLGLATRELGIEQGDLLGIVKSINQALILSGASAKEANNGLIQLSQGIASNRLGGDELRSTLEQLPAVADVIARQLGVTRGELRAMGAEGTITADTIIQAFKNAKDVLEEQFGSTIPTLSQSLVVLRNNLIVFFGELNQGTGTLAALGSIIRFIGNNVQTLARTLGVAAAAFVALRLAPTIQAFFRLQAAVKAGNAVILGSALATKMKAEFDRDQVAATLRVASSEALRAKGIVTATQAEAAQTVQTLRSIQAQEAQIAVQVQGRAANLQAAQAALAQAQADRANIALSGTVADVRRRVALAEVDLAATRRGAVLAAEQLAAAEARLAVAQGLTSNAVRAAGANHMRLAAAQAAATTTANAQTAAEARLAAATAAANAQANIFTRTLDGIKQGISGLFTLILRNPLATFVVTLTTAAAALFIFRDKIKVAEDSIATIGDVLEEFAFQASVAFDQVLSVLDDVFGGMATKIRDFVSNFKFGFKDVVQALAAFTDTLLGVFTGIFAFIGSLLLDFPQIMKRGFVLAVNAAITALEFLPDVVIGIIKTIGQTLDIFITGQIRAFELLGQSAQAALTGNFGAAKRAAEEAAFASANAFERASDGVGKRFATNIAAELKDELVPRMDETATKSFSEIGATAASAFAAAFKSSPVLDFVNGLFEGAERRAAGADVDASQEKANKARDEAARLAGLQKEAFDGVIGKLKEEQEVLKATLAGDKASGDAKRAIIDLNNKLAEQKLPPLSGEQEAELTALVRRNDQLGQYLQLQQELIPVEQQFLDKRVLIQQAFADGAISFDQYTEALRRLRIEEAEVGTSVSDGLVTGFEKVKTQMMDLAAVAETALVNAFQSAEDALVQFVTTGKVDMKKFALSIIGDIARIIARLLILHAIQLITGTAPAAAASSSLSGAGSAAVTIGGMPPLAAEGSTMAMANKPFIVGENGPELFTPGQTGSITPNDQTIGALSKASAGMGGTTVVQAPAPAVNLSVVNVTDPKEALTALNTPEGEQMILNVLQKNPEMVKRLSS
jgi:lambda family phage tail tape measure protein